MARQQPKRRRRGSYSTSTKIPIHSLSGGVGRQAPSKRLPTEAENMDNVLVTLERSFEKRAGFEVVPTYSGGSYLQGYLSDMTDCDCLWTWFLINDDNQYLVRIFYDAAATQGNVFAIWRLDTSDPDTPFLVAEAAPTAHLDTLAYITHGAGTYTAKDAIRVVMFGTKMLVLNTKVKAGFTSTAEDANGYYYLKDLDGVSLYDSGNVYNDLDLTGPKFQYYTSALYDTSANPYVPHDDTDVGAFTNIPIEDLTDYVFDFPQSVPDFSEINFPPDTNDWYVVNWFQSYPGSSGALTEDNALTKIVLNRLHDPLHPYYNASPGDDESTANGTEVEWPWDTGNTYDLVFPNGHGKIYECRAGYLTQPPGYYRIISFEEGKEYNPGGGALDGQGRPYTQRVRTPDEYSVIDKRRMPQELSLDGGIWTANPVDWAPRYAGDKTSNPGPSVFLDGDGNAVERQINAMAYYRGRLWFASGDTLFSSRQNDAANLYYRDPGNPTSSDPIDTPASSNTYAEISAMVPFNEFLFVNTLGDIQFELSGSENQITPQTAELKPTTFYATDPLVDPLLMGSQVYFFAPRRLYIYFADTTLSLNSAVEVSLHCPDYLPQNIGYACASPAHDTIFATDNDNPNYIYCYTNRFSGDRVVQNSFYRYYLSDDHDIKSMFAFENYLYTVVDVNHIQYLHRVLLRKAEDNIPRIDHLFTLLVDATNTSYDESGIGSTTFTLANYEDEDIDQVVLGTGWDDEENTVFGEPTVVVAGGDTTITIPGNYYDEDGDRIVYFGHSFHAEVELSTQFVRDEENNPIDGVLNLRSMMTRHFNTGAYDVEVYRRGRGPLTTTFNSLGSELHTIYDDDAVVPLVEEEGKLISKIFGYSDTTVIKITSDYATPMNITNIELKGKFKQRYTAANT